MNVNDLAESIKDEEYPQSGVLWIPDGGDYGLGDRLRGLGSGLLIARLFDLPLHVQWKPNRQCPFEFDDLFEVDDCFTFAGEEPEVDFDPAIILSFRMNPMPWHVWEYISASQIRIFNGSRQAWIQMWRQAVRTLEPRADLKREIDHFWNSTYDEKPVGIHLRRTDNLTVGSRDMNLDNVARYDEALRERVRMIVRENPESSFFLASDNREYADRWEADLREAGIKIATFPKSWQSEDFRQTSGDAVVADLICLARCKTIINSCFSSIVYVAHGYGRASIQQVDPE